MTSRRIFPRICLLLPAVLLATHCGREDAPEFRSESTGGAKSSKVLADRSPETVPAEVAATKHRLEGVLKSEDYKRGFGIVRELKEAGHFVEASDAMGETLRRMDPAGMAAADAVSVIGEPDVKSGQEMLYRFDNGYSGSLWALKLEDGTVSGFERRDID